MPEFEFPIHARVRIAANGREGRVRALYADEGGTQFDIEYVDDNGLVSSRYFRASDIAAA